MTIGNKIWAYFRNGQVGREASRLEQEALTDPFLYEALEGMEGVEAGHEQIVAALQQRIGGQKRQQKHFGLVVWMVAASLALVGGVALWLLNGPEDIQQVAMTYRLPDSLNVVDDVEQPEMPEMVLAAPVRIEADESDAQSAASMQTQTVDIQIAPDTLRRPSGLVVTGRRHMRMLAADTVNMALKMKEDTTATVETVSDKNSRKRKTIRGPEPPKRRASGERRKNYVPENVKTGWQEEFDRYVADSLRYPEDARAAMLEGEVVLSVHMNKRHRPSRIKLVRKLSRSCDREAIRLVEEYPGTWDAGERDFTVVVRFKLKDD